IVWIFSFSRMERTLSKSNLASRWCIPALRMDSPWSAHHRPTVLNCPRECSGSLEKSICASSGKRSTSRKSTSPVSGCSMTCAPPPLPSLPPPPRRRSDFSSLWLGGGGGEGTGGDESKTGEEKKKKKKQRGGGTPPDG